MPRQLGADPTRWTFLTGDRDEIDKFASRFGVVDRARPERPEGHHPQPADGDHRRQRQAGEGVTGNEWTPDQVLADLEVVRTALDGRPARLKQQAFTPRERRLIARLRTPLAVQRYLNRLPYNTEPAPGGATLRSFRGVVRARLARTASRRRCSRPSSSNSTAIRRSS